MAWFPRRPPPSRLFLHRPDGRSLRRELPPAALDSLAQRILQQGGAAAAQAWRRSGQFGSAAVLAAWPEGVEPPVQALLCRGEANRTGAWLEAAFAPEAAIQEIAEDLEQALLGQEPVARVLAEPESASPPALARPVARKPPPADAESFTLVEPVEGPMWLDDSVEVRPADLPGLYPGDRLASPRRGPCVIVNLNPGPGRILLRNERGHKIEVTHAELTGEFSFDDAEDPATRG